MSNLPPAAVAQYRKKPIVIEAARLIDQDHENENMVAVADWISDNGGRCDQGPHEIVIHTLEGPFVARHGDYVIRGVAGEFYRCDPEIFEASYELVACGSEYFGRRCVLPIGHLDPHWGPFTKAQAGEDSPAEESKTEGFRKLGLSRGGGDAEFGVGY